MPIIALFSVKYILLHCLKILLIFFLLNILTVVLRITINFLIYNSLALFNIKLLLIAHRRCYCVSPFIVPCMWDHWPINYNFLCYRYTNAELNYWCVFLNKNQVGKSNRQKYLNTVFYIYLCSYHYDALHIFIWIWVICSVL